MTTRRRAMTMVELLAALALLSILFLGASSWIAASASMQRAIDSQLRFEHAAQALLERIREDITTGDFPLSVYSDREPARVRVEHGELRIRTRSRAAGQSRGGVERVYALDPENASIFVREMGASGEAGERTLLRRVQALEVQLHDHRERAGGGIRALSITIRSSGGVTVESEIVVP